MSHAELRTRLDEFAARHRLRGLTQRTQRERFIGCLIASEKKFRALRMKKFSGHSDDSKRGFHPLLAIVEDFEKSERDEAIWLAFLCIHFGWVNQDGKPSDTVRLFYGKFGKGKWDWSTVVRSPARVREWMIKLSKAQLGQLGFENHRKYETNNPRSATGTAAVISSFVAWVAQNGNGSPWKAFDSVTKMTSTPEKAFDCLYETLKVKRFGRTARFDLLCLLGNLDILDVSPAHCYLRNATGPKAGALLLVTGKKKGPLTRGIEKTIRQLQCYLGVSVQVLEDALCNWQKGNGFLSRMCP
jgi:hypothetical protein